MSEGGTRYPAARKKRVQRLKRLILITLFILIFLPYLFCAAIMFRIHDLNDALDGLSVQLTELEGAIGRLQAAGTAVPVFGQMQQAGSPMPGQTQEPVVTRPADAAEPGDGAAEPVAGEGQDGSAEWDDPEAGLRKVYLTFDDGPSPNTGKILDILAKYDVKATFFVVGREDERSKEALRRIVDEGHTLGMHSYSHKYSEIYASLDNFKEDLQKERDYLSEVTGVESNVYRFPGGSSNTVSSLDIHLFADYLDSQDIVFFDWNISSGDGGSRLLSTDELIRNCTGTIGNWKTAVVLMHDSTEKPTTVEALPAVIEKLQAREDVLILPITEDTVPVQHIRKEE